MRTLTERPFLGFSSLTTLAYVVMPPGSLRFVRFGGRVAMRVEDLGMENRLIRPQVERESSSKSGLKEGGYGSDLARRSW